MLSEKMKDLASRAPPLPPLEPLLKFMERYIRKPLEGTLFDTWIATPAKNYYIACKRMD